MPTIIITLEDALSPDGRPICRYKTAIPEDAQHVDVGDSLAFTHALVIRTLAETGVMTHLAPLAQVQVQHRQLTDYLKKIGALDEHGNLNVRVGSPRTIDAQATEVTPERTCQGDCGNADCPA